MSEEGVEDEVVGALRVAVQAGGQLAEMLARVHAQRVRELAGKDQQEAAQLRSRMDAERASAVAYLEQTKAADWLQTATPAQVGEAYGTAAAWRDFAPEAEAAERAMREELRDRYGIDVDATGADPDRVRAQLEEYQRRQADAERTEAGKEQAEANQLMRQADRLDRLGDLEQDVASTGAEPQAGIAAAAADEQYAGVAQARGEADAGYDSVERRAAFANDMQEKGIDVEHVGTRIRADVSQGRPAREAVASKSPAKDRRGRGQQSRGREADLGR